MNKKEMLKKQIEEIEAKEKAEKEEKAKKIWENYLKAKEKAYAEISSKKNQIDELIAQCEQISEEYGVPFAADWGNNFTPRGYMPKSFEREWEEAIKLGSVFENDNWGDQSDFADAVNSDLDIYWGEYENKGGWQYWSASSLTC